MPAFKTLGGHYRIRVKDLVRVLREKGIPVPAALEPRFTIAVVDEDAAFQAQIRGFFSAKPGTFEIKPFLNGYDALMEIGRKSPDLVLLNVRLTSLDGFQLLSRLKSNPDTEGLKILAISDIPADAQTAVSTGAVDAFTKSDGFPALLEKIKRVADDKFLDFPTLPSEM